MPCSLPRCMFSAGRSMPGVLPPALNRWSLMVTLKKLSIRSDPTSLVPVISESTLEMPVLARGPRYVTFGFSKPCVCFFYNLNFALFLSWWKVHVRVIDFQIGAEYAATCTCIACYQLLRLQAGSRRLPSAWSWCRVRRQESECVRSDRRPSRIHWRRQDSA